jgi:hypothetical protein
MRQSASPSAIAGTRPGRRDDAAVVGATCASITIARPSGAADKQIVWFHRLGSITRKQDFASFYDCVVGTECNGAAHFAIRRCKRVAA